MNTPPTHFPASQRTNYQFPVYRWIGWLAVAGFAIGLTLMFFISGLFGVPAPLAWAFLVILFTFGALLLDRPKLLLNGMLFYYLLMPENRIFGLMWVPLPGFIDELFFIPVIAVIVMNWIQRRQLKEATLFPLIFILIAMVSWYVNGRPSPITTVRVIQTVLRPYILWYYCRLTCTFKDEKELNRWFWIFIGYATVQFFYNVLWQGRPWVWMTPDWSGGVFGPVGNKAHFVGYFSIIALYVGWGWWITFGQAQRRKVRHLALICLLIIAYNLIYMTDTKHALLMMPLAFIPFLLHPSYSVKARLLSAGFIVLLGLASALLFASGRFGGSEGLYFYRQMAINSPKGDMYKAVTTEFHYLVPYPLLGAGAGRFGSFQSIENRTPLARRYYIPYDDEFRRIKLVKGDVNQTVQGSTLRSPFSWITMIVSEFGWLGGAAYFYFLFWVAYKLWRKSTLFPRHSLVGGVALGLSASLLMVFLISSLSISLGVPLIYVFIWMFIGRLWDMEKPAEQASGQMAALPER